MFPYSPILPQKHPQRGREQVFSSQTRITLKLSYLQQYTTDSNQIFYNDKDDELCFMCGPSIRRTNPRWRAAAILKNRKMDIIISASLHDWHEIWHGDAYWPFEVYRQLKFPTFKNPKWRTAAILQNRKTAIFRQRFNRSAPNLIS